MSLINRNRWYHTGSQDNRFHARWFTLEHPSLFNFRDFNDELDYFLVMVFDPDGINRLKLEKIVQGKLLSQVQDVNNKLHLFLYNSQEGFHTIVEPIYQLIERYSIPPSKVILGSGSFNILEDVDRVRKKYNAEQIKVEAILDFERNMVETHRYKIDTDPEYIPAVTLNKTQYDKKYINFNRRWRPARPVFVAMLHREKLLDHGYVSLANADCGTRWDAYWQNMQRSLECPQVNDIVAEVADSMNDILPLYLDTTDLVTNRADVEYHTQAFYEDTYFSLIAETYFFQTHGNIHFFSEKTFKAIMFKHPFILISCPGTLKTLRSIGYKTFSPYIDESYDDIANDGDRLIKILYETKRLCELTPTELAEFCEVCKEITEYNYNLLLSRTSHTRRLNF